MWKWRMTDWDWLHSIILRFWAKKITARIELHYFQACWQLFYNKLIENYKRYIKIIKKSIDYFAGGTFSAICGLNYADTKEPVYVVVPLYCEAGVGGGGGEKFYQRGNFHAMIVVNTFRIGKGPLNPWMLFFTLSIESHHVVTQLKVSPRYVLANLQLTKHILRHSTREPCYCFATKKKTWFFYNKTAQASTDSLNSQTGLEKWGGERQRLGPFFLIMQSTRYYYSAWYRSLRCLRVQTREAQSWALAVFLNRKWFYTNRK